ncbi:MAG: hypothetical protein K2I06_11335 [Ruminococcus sp.]|nr:hypothetical protein [Ruminococcus sp.]
MSKGKGFFSKLKRSTIITMVSCISFVVMTFLALLFFVKFPVTPSEKFTAELGRESIYRQNGVDGLQMTATSTEVPQTTTETSSQTTTETTTAKTDFVITITTGKGFRTDGHTLTVNADYEENDHLQDSEETSQTTTTDDSENYNYNDNYYDSYDYDYGWGY